VAGDHIGGCTQLLSEHDTGALAERFDQAGIVWAEPTPEEQCSVTANGGSSANGRTSGGAIKRGANSVLNAPIVGSSALDDALGDGAGSAAALSTALQKRMLLLMDDHLLDDGSRVDYARLRVSPAFASFCEAAGALRDLPREALGPTAPEGDRKAFWINLYNCLVLHATATLGAPADAAQRTQFFTGGSGGAYLICGQRFTLDEIEHGVLRSNALQVGASSPLFGPDDPRLEFVLPALDPRIHFALNCGARSCPPIKFYAAERLEEGLALSARAFLEADLAPDLPAAQLSCTKLLDWYGADFGPTPRDVIARVRGLLPAGAPLHDELGALLRKGAPEPQLVYRPYDWGSNDAVVDDGLPASAAAAAASQGDAAV